MCRQLDRERIGLLPPNDQTVNLHRKIPYCVQQLCVFMQTAPWVAEEKTNKQTTKKTHNSLWDHVISCESENDSLQNIFNEKHLYKWITWLPGLGHLINLIVNFYKLTVKLINLT